jgi:hypothetical protein
MWPHSILAGFDGVKAHIFPGFLHESAEQDKRKELTLKGFKYPSPLDIEDAEVNPLHVIFDLKGVLVGKDYF